MVMVIIKGKNKEIKAYHLKCMHELMKGLMFKKRGNALLEFNRPGKYGIWMLFMRYHLRLYFIDENLKVIGSVNAQKMTLNPKTWKIYSFPTPYKFVLEVDSREDFTLKEGEKIEVCFSK